MAQYCDNFYFRDDDNDSFEFWAGLRGPKGDQGADGAPGSSVELKGPVATTGDLPASAPADELWMVGSESPYTGYFWNGSQWVDLGYILQGPEGEQGPAGEDGADGQDGVSPTVTITTITGGHTVTITDAEHPSGQSFSVMDGEDGATGATGATGPAGPGVPAGGTTGQVLKKASGTDYDTEWGTGGGSGPDPYTSPAANLASTASAGQSDNYSRGDHVHQLPSASDVGAIPEPSTAPSSGQVLTYNGSAWAAETPHGIPAGGIAPSVLMKISNTDYDVEWKQFPSNKPYADSGTGSWGTHSTPCRWDHVHPINVLASDSQTTPAMDGTAAVGSADTYARSDHVHPIDTTRAAADLGISGASAGNLVKIATVSSGAPATFTAAAAGTDYQTPLTAMTNYQTPVHRATVDLLFNGWDQDNSGDPYTYALTIQGATITANTKVDIQLDAAGLTYLIGKSVQAVYVDNTNGTLTIVAVGGDPTGESSSDNITAQFTYYETV